MGTYEFVRLRAKLRHQTQTTLRKYRVNSRVLSAIAEHDAMGHDGIGCGCLDVLDLIAQPWTEAELREAWGR